MPLSALPFHSLFLPRFALQTSDDRRVRPRSGWGNQRGGVPGDYDGRGMTWEGGTGEEEEDAIAERRDGTGRLAGLHLCTFGFVGIIRAEVWTISRDLIVCILHHSTTPMDYHAQ